MFLVQIVYGFEYFETEKRQINRKKKFFLHKIKNKLLLQCQN